MSGTNDLDLELLEEIVTCTPSIAKNFLQFMQEKKIGAT